MRLSLIAAVARNRVIGVNGELPWHLPADLKQFRKLTLGKPIIMGRATYESIGRPLPERLNIVISTNPNFQAPGCCVAQSLAEGIAAAGDTPEVMIIGGEQLSRQALPQADRLYLTLVDAAVEGDRHFPDYDPNEWRESNRSCFDADAINPHGYCFVELQRLKARPSADPAPAART
ncbi:MAG: type 3 dihydrofolate reductase [Gammaproteobacteria bacterium]|nr:type 3 dihydrofolate reductase [Gammaproteobacteria bacterium]